MHEAEDFQISELANLQINLVVINISTWSGYDATAKHYYGSITYITDPAITTVNVANRATKYGGRTFDIRRKITEAEAREIDKSDGGHTYVKQWQIGNRMTTRFDTIQDVINAGQARCQELNMKCPIINLYDWCIYDDSKIIEPKP